MIGIVWSREIDDFEFYSWPIFVACSSIQESTVYPGVTWTQARGNSESFVSQNSGSLETEQPCEAVS